MKTTAWIVGTLVALFASTIDADGVCFDSVRDDIGGDMKFIKEKGFTHVRTYNTHRLDKMAAADLRLMVGVSLDNLAAQLNTIAGVIGNVEYIMVGNENLAGQGWVPQSMIDAIAEVKRRFPGVKVGTVQRATEYIHPIGNMAALVGVSDVLGVNIHPFFTGVNNDINRAIEVAHDQWTKSKAWFDQNGGGGKRFLLTETGWPSAGVAAGNTGSVGGTEAYYKAYKESTIFKYLPGNEKFYFQFFDTSYREREGGHETSFGLYTENKVPKWGAGAVGAPTPAPTPAPTTPAPTTPAPTTVAPVAANSTSGSADNEDAAGSGSASLADAGDVGDESKTDTDLGIANNEDAATDLTPSPEDGATETGGEDNNDEAEEANTQSSSASSTAGLVVVIMLGCAAVAGAFGFIYKARQKAAEMERSESKSFDMSVTPGGACVL